MTLILESQRQHLIEVEDFLVVEFDILVPNTFESPQFFDFLFIRGFFFFGFGESLEEVSSHFINFTLKIITRFVIF